MGIGSVDWFRLGSGDVAITVEDRVGRDQPALDSVEQALLQSPQGSNQGMYQKAPPKSRP